MFKQFVGLSLGLFVINLIIIPCDGLSGGYNAKYESIGYKENAQLKSPRLALPDLSNGFLEPQRGLGISAWGIVTVVVSFFLAVVGMYYISICYPVICKRNQNKYMVGP